MTRKHGYGGYTDGCRCQTCRTAKADYQRQRRAAARQLAHRFTTTSDGRPANRSGNAWAPGATRLVLDLNRHGLAGYDEHGCRCRTCTDAGLQARRPRRVTP
jgi:hypothetical protein